MKYRLTNQTKIVRGHTLYRIQRCVDKQLGGWIESVRNLSQTGLAWVSGNAKVYGRAQVYGNAQVYSNASVYDNATVSGGAQVYGNALVYGNAQVYNDARVYGNAQVYGNALVYANTKVLENDRICRVTDLFCLNLYGYSVSITKNRIKIGCQIRSFAEWMKLSKKDAAKLGFNIKYYAKAKKIIKALYEGLDK